MALIMVKTGEFKGEEWVLQGDKLINGFFKVKELPLSELVSLSKIEEIDKLLYVEFEFSNGISFTASMKSKVYAELYEIFLSCKDTDINKTTINESKTTIKDIEIDHGYKVSIDDSETPKTKKALKPFQVLEKNNIIIVVNLLDEESSKEINSFKEQDFELYGEIIQASSGNEAKKVYIATKKANQNDSWKNGEVLAKKSTKNTWIAIGVTMFLGLMFLRGGGGEKHKTDPAEDAYIYCKIAVEDAAKYGVDFHWDNNKVIVPYEDGRYRVDFNFKIKNAFGSYGKARAGCTVRGTTVVKLAIDGNKVY